MDKPVKKRPNLYIVNLQWTPKDDVANMKLHGRCDMVMKKVMDLLGISVPPYQNHLDPIYQHATELNEMEMHTTTQPFLKASSEGIKEEKSESEVQTEMKDFVNDAPLDIKDDLLNCDSSDKSNSCLPEQEMYAEIDLFNSDFPIIFSDYSELFLYPYQTSFLYSGLHSIINPVQVFTERQTEDKLVLTVSKANEKLPECEYCNTHLDSKSCLFYLKCEPVFANELFRYSKIEKKEKPNICVCCDYTTDEDDSESYIDNSNKKIVAGWFGKGYRKGKKTKKKTL
ncbi:unnamed protein product [Acanthoscelides obtectus]|nr:unnamed protein product [Acanthoscelides obtectus]CAK1670746.1 NAD-dependent protein deacetylase Sirt7 [Acanthoscelides obtectus]